MKKKIVLVGAGGHSKVIIDAICCDKEFSIYGIVDACIPKGQKVLGVTVLGSDSILSALYAKGIRYAFIAVGSMGDCSVRRRLDGMLGKLKFKLPVIMHPSAVVARDVIEHIGEGTFIAAGAVVNPGTRIGRNVIINTAASVDHDCDIGEFAHIAPGVTLSGGVKVGAGTHVGTGAGVIQNVTVGKDAFVAAGLTLRENLADGGRYSRKSGSVDEKE